MDKYIVYENDLLKHTFIFKKKKEIYSVNILAYNDNNNKIRFVLFVAMICFVFYKIK